LRQIRRVEQTRHSYPTNAFVRRTKDLRSFIRSKTERLINPDTRVSLGGASPREVEIFATGPNCGIRKRMFKMGLIESSLHRPKGGLCKRFKRAYCSAATVTTGAHIKLPVSLVEVTDTA
jgi:hypothetical protein